jgi:hypothetical protein
MHYEKLGYADFEQASKKGDIYGIWEFLDFVWLGDITPEDGSIGEVIIDTQRTDIFVEGWMLDWGSSGYNRVSLHTIVDHCFYQFDILKNRVKVDIVWCNK